MALPMRCCGQGVYLKLKYFRRHQLSRFYATQKRKGKGLVLGVYDDGDIGVKLSKVTSSCNEQSGGRIQQLLDVSGYNLKAGDSRLFHGLPVDGADTSVAVICIGKTGVGYDEHEECDVGKEQVRKAAAAGVGQLKAIGVKHVHVDPCGDATAAAEGATLALHVYDELKSADSKSDPITVKCYSDDSQDLWNEGVILAEGQNFARRLMQAPANKMTPTIFTDESCNILNKLGVKCIVRDKSWVESEKMGAFLSVARGSEEPLKFLELEYTGTVDSSKPFALVGKGVTFDSGGISIKPANGMEAMRADMGGAACVVGSFLSAAKLKLPINIKGFIPLCENMLSGRAMRPGDVVTARNGKTIQIDNTDAEGRLVLADALCYAETFNPTGILDMATLTGAIVVALGSSAAGTFTNSNYMWDHMKQASVKTGDRVWRMPLWNFYSELIKKCQLADLNNIGPPGVGGGSSSAAAFLKEFVTNKNWMHLDIAGVMESKDGYLGQGMSGRPTRTVVEFLRRLSKERKQLD